MKEDTIKFASNFLPSVMKNSIEQKWKIFKAHITTHGLSCANQDTSSRHSPPWMTNQQKRTCLSTQLGSLATQQRCSSRPTNSCRAALVRRHMWAIISKDFKRSRGPLLTTSLLLSNRNQSFFSIVQWIFEQSQWFLLIASSRSCRFANDSCRPSYTKSCRIF